MKHENFKLIGINTILSQNHRLLGLKVSHGSSGPNFLGKSSLNKMAQHPFQLNLRSVQWCGNHHFHWEISPMADCTRYEEFSSCVQSELLSLFHWESCLTATIKVYYQIYYVFTSKHIKDLTSILLFQI